MRDNTNILKQDLYGAGNTEDSKSGTPLWIFIVIAVAVLLLCGILAGFAMRKNGNKDDVDFDEFMENVDHATANQNQNQRGFVPLQEYSPHAQYNFQNGASWQVGTI